MSRKFGMEVEFISSLSREAVENYLDSNGYTSKGWKVTSDGSLRGEIGFKYTHELVSPILDMDDEDQISDFKEILRYLNLYSRVNNSCGFHVHVDGRDFGFEDLKNLVRFYSRWEVVLSMMVPQTRIQGRFCRTWSEKRLPVDKLVASKNISEFRDIWYNGYSERERQFKYNETRYSFLNLHSWNQYGSFEFRAHQGSLNFVKMINWVKVCMGFVDHCKSVRCGYVSQIKMEMVRDRIARDRKYLMAQVREFIGKAGFDEEIKDVVLMRVKKYYILGVSN